VVGDECEEFRGRQVKSPTAADGSESAEEGEVVVEEEVAEVVRGDEGPEGGGESDGEDEAGDAEGGEEEGGVEEEEGEADEGERGSGEGDDGGAEVDGEGEVVFEEVAVEVASVEEGGGEVEVGAFVEEGLVVAEEEGDGEGEEEEEVAGLLTQELSIAGRLKGEERLSSLYTDYGLIPLKARGPKNAQWACRISGSSATRTGDESPLSLILALQITCLTR